MKKILKIFGIFLGVIILMVGGFVAYAGMTPMKEFEVVSPAIVLPTDSVSLAFGQTFVENVCAHCHLGEDGKLSGRLFNRAEDPFGEMWTANISQHPVNGIGRYSDGELAYIIRTGVNREGRFTGYMMCHPLMSDADIASVIAFLRSDADIMKPTDIVRPIPEYVNSTLVKAFVKLGMYTPLAYSNNPIPSIDKNDKVAYGKYLSTAVYECVNCHSASFETVNLFEPEKSPGFFGGGQLIPDKNFNMTPAGNLTSSRAFGIGTWTEAQFISAVKHGQRNDGSKMKIQMPLFADLSDEDVSAIWTYLKTIPVIEVNAASVTK